MRTASERIRGFKFGLAFALVVALCGWLSIPAVRQRILPAFAHVRVSDVIETNGSPLGHQERSWIGRAITPEPIDPKNRAIRELEDAGMPFTAEGFLRATATGYRPLIDRFVQAGMPVDTVDEDGRSALLTAALAKDWSLVRHLQDLGANVNRADAHGFTVLMAAAMAGHDETVRILLSTGADVNAVDEHSHSALHYAVATKNANVVNMLIDKGASVVLACCENRTLMSHALDTRDWRIVEPILSRQPGKVAWSDFTRSEFVRSLANRDSGRTKLLLAKHDDAPTPLGSTTPTLAHLIANGDLQGTKFLLDCGADPNTPLNSPVEKSFTQRVSKPFLKHYLDNEEGMTVLMLAAGLGQVDLVQTLLDHGAKRGIGTKKYGMPALLFATRSDNMETAQALIEGSPKPEELRVEISLGAQRLSLVKNNAPIFSSEVSTGRVGFSTPAGNYVITDKHLSHMSTIYKVKMPFFMRLNGRDFGMHEGVVPGYPASHGCIRLPGSVAQRFFKDLPMGTLVSITP